MLLIYKCFYVYDIGYKWLYISRSEISRNACLYHLLCTIIDTEQSKECLLRRFRFKAQNIFLYVSTDAVLQFKVIKVMCYNISQKTSNFIHQSSLNYHPDKSNFSHFYKLSMTALIMFIMFLQIVQIIATVMSRTIIIQNC